MPSSLHEALVELFRDRPELVVELLRRAALVELPIDTEASVGSVDLGQATPGVFLADSVAVLRTAGSDQPRLAVVVEVQLAPDADKPWIWPEYVASARARLRCQACLLVLTPDEGVARWAERRIDIGPGSSVQPMVLGPKTVPAVVEVEVAARCPELGVLSAVMHGRGGNERLAAEVAFAALTACESLQERAGVLYSDLIQGSLSEGALKELEQMIRLEGYQWQGPTARKAFSEGKVEGKAEGKAEGEAHAILAVLEARGLPPNREERERILSCADCGILCRWLRRAAVVESVEDVFSE